jgi:transcriptional regulator with XRE-family HTH domain
MTRPISSTSEKNTVGGRLATARLKMGLSQAELAELLGCSQPHISSVECGRVNLSPRLQGLAAKHLKVSESWLEGSRG